MIVTLTPLEYPLLIAGIYFAMLAAAGLGLLAQWRRGRNKRY
jgi:hypothetical protein